MDNPFEPEPDEKFPEPPEMPMYEKTMAEARREEYGIQQASTAALAGADAHPHRPTITELLQHKKSHLEFELEQVNKALEIAKQNQGAMDLMDSIAKTRVHG